MTEESRSAPTPLAGVPNADVSGQESLPLPELEPTRKALQAIETLLFAADAPLPLGRLAELAEESPERTLAAIGMLNQDYEAGGRTFRIHKVAEGYQLYTLPEFAGLVRQLYKRQLVQRLSHPAHEVLAIIAYKQPLTRPEIEKLRGVDCSGPLFTLMERQLIATAGRARRPGSPFLYRTTREFLRYFGLQSLDDLPQLEGLGALLSRESDEAAGTAVEPDPESPAAGRANEPDSDASPDGMPGDDEQRTN